MRAALCLSGYFSNSKGINDGLAGYSYMDRKLLSKHNVDVFIHSWDLENKEKILSLYNPIDSVFEQQKDFSKELEKGNESYFFEKGAYYHNTMFKTFSVSFSRSQSVQLKKLYETKNDFLYDCVVMARFDLGQRGKEHSQKYYATNFNFNETLDMSYVYSAFWDQLNHGFADHWFFSNSKNMDVVSSLHDNLLDYYSPSSKYVKNVTTGWPDSDTYNDFSNEFFNHGSSQNKKTWPLNACIDNHKLYKWHFINTGLYKVCKFIDITEDR